MAWTIGDSPKRCEREYKDCGFMVYGRFECNIRRLQCLYKYCSTYVRYKKTKVKQSAVRLSACLFKYAIPSPMWIDLSKG
ncbi:hypothetical protein ScPMuIL_016768 [Solemya velum]